MYYSMTIAGLKRDLPICPVNENLSIAGFVIFGDQELTVACARELLKKAPEYDYIITAEAKGIPLAHEMARQAGDAKYFVARKGSKLYMRDTFGVAVRSITTDREQHLYLDGEDIYYADGENTTKVINVNELNILGTHNYENVMAATGIALSLGVPMDKIVEVLKRFQAVEHRIEYVTEKRGVKFYNDSKGTNPDAAIKGICAMNCPTLLIGGGYDKQSEYDEWIESFGGKVKLLVLIGQTREKIAACARAHGFENIVLCDTFEEAIDTCYRNAVSGDAVLLSPACASWGMFKNYEERGRIFKEYVRALKED